MFVNIVEFPPIVPGKEQQFEDWFTWSNSLYETFPGFVSRRLLKPTSADGPYLGIVEHESEETFMAMHTSETREPRCSLAAEPVEAGVVEGAWVFDRLEVGEDRRVRKLRADLRLDALEQLVSLLHRPAAGDEHVHRDERPPAGLPVADRVEDDPLRVVGLEGGVERGLLHG